MSNTVQKTKDHIKNVQKLEDVMIDHGALVGHECDAEALPLEHVFTPGLYSRHIFMRKGTLLTSKVHKTEHPYFVMTGKCSVLTEDGVEHIQAPFMGVTKPGTKRVLYIHEDCDWVTCHPTDETDLEKIETELIAKTFNDLQLSEDDMNELKGGGLSRGLQ